MRKLVSLLAVAVAFAFIGLTARAVEEKTIKGEAQCAKCTLKETAACQAAVKVTEDGKTVVYYVEQNEVAKKVHAKICPPNSSAKFEVTGVVSEKEGKKHIVPTKIEILN